LGTKLPVSRRLPATIVVCILALAAASLTARAALPAKSPRATPAATKRPQHKWAPVRHKRVRHKKPVHHKKPVRHKKPWPGTTSAKGPPPTGPSPAAFNRESYGYVSTLSPRAEANRYGVMVLESTDASWVPILHAANPHLKLLVYQDIERASAGDPQRCTDVTGDLRNHPDWFLKSSAGQPVYTAAVPPNAPASYHMDIGQRGYQQACVADGIALAKRDGFDGIFMDGLDGRMGYQFGHLSVPTVPKYPTDAAWQASMYSFLQYAGPTIRSAGLLAFGNIGGAQLALWSRWNGPLDGAEEEAWSDGGSGLAAWLWWWHQQLANAAWSAAHGKYELLHSHNTTEAGNRYGLASMLLVAGGRATYSTSNANYSRDESWYPEYGTAVALGAPYGPYHRRTGGVYERDFAHGIVLVNASLATIPRFSLGASYSGVGLSHVKSVSMAPTSALIMTAG
jgi:hypothetical protein